LKIFLSKTRHITAGEMKEFQNHSTHALKMAWSASTAELIGHRTRTYPSLTAPRVHRVNCRQENGIAASRTRLFQIPLFVSGICIEIFSGPKLSRVYENRGNHGIRVGSDAVYQTQMTGVEISHRRNQTHSMAGLMCLGDELSNLINAPQNSHMSASKSLEGLVVTVGQSGKNTFSNFLGECG